MHYDDFLKLISKIKNLPLPGEEAHYKMTPKVRINELKSIDVDAKKPKKAGVLSLFYPSEDYTAHLLLTLRKSYKGVHANQISFPGGKIERTDASLLDTALRETQEEVGVNPNLVTIIKPLTQVYIPPSNFKVQPYIGVAKTTLSFTKQEEEVAELVQVPVVNFLDDQAVFYQTLSTSYAKNIKVPAFNLNGYTVWGATAMMLSEVKELFKQVL